MATPLISIIVPCYNQAQYLDECLQSIIDQTFGNWECIIVNDGSPDNTEEIAQKWVETDTRFIYLKKENGGVSSARNFGIKEARGEWILPLDGDDYLNTIILDEFNNVKKNSTMFAYFGTKTFGKDAQEFYPPIFSYERLLKKNFLTCSCIYRKSEWEKINGYDTHADNGYEDWEFYVRLLTNISLESILILNIMGLYYRIEIDSRSSRICHEKNRKIVSENYIFLKNRNIYQSFFPSVMELLQKNDHLESLTKNIKEKNIIAQNINKNIITKVLYRIIKFLN